MTAKKSTVHTPTLLANFERYLYARLGLGQTTVHNYISAMRRLIPVLGAHPTARAVEQHIADMRKAGLSQSHQVNTAIVLERYGDFIHVKIRLARPRVPYGLVRGTLSEAEVARLIGSAHTLRVKAVLALLAYSGVRNRELCDLRIRDLDQANQRLLIHGAKNKRDRVSIIVPACMALLTEYLRDRPTDQDQYLFTTVRHGHNLQTQDVRKIVRTSAERAGVTKRVFPHLMRHSLATNLLTRGAGLLAIKEQLGHAFIATTMRYIHSAPARLQEEYRMHAPSYL